MRAMGSKSGLDNGGMQSGHSVNRNKPVHADGNWGTNLDLGAFGHFRFNNDDAAYRTPIDVSGQTEIQLMWQRGRVKLFCQFNLVAIRWLLSSCRRFHQVLLTLFT